MNFSSCIVGSSGGGGLWCAASALSFSGPVLGSVLVPMIFQAAGVSLISNIALGGITGALNLFLTNLYLCVRGKRSCVSSGDGVSAREGLSLTEAVVIGLITLPLSMVLAKNVISTLPCFSVISYTHLSLFGVASLIPLHIVLFIYLFARL